MLEIIIHCHRESAPPMPLVLLHVGGGPACAADAGPVQGAGAVQRGVGVCQAAPL